MKFHPLDHPLNWYRYDVSGSIEILNAYVTDVEQQAAKSAADFEAESKEVVIEGSHPDEPPRLITIHKGLDDESWDLHTIFREYFPNLQRRSALITLFSFFEHELNKLCALFQSTEKYKLSFGDLTGSGIERARAYLRKVASVDLIEPPGPWNVVKKIQALRNLVVHADGRFPQDGSAERSALRQYVESSEYLTGDREVLLRAGYLKHVLDCFDAYFNQVNNAIHRRYDA